MWSGTASFLSINWLSPFITHLFTDSASSVGFAGFCDGQWFNARWSEFAPDVKNVCIELLEMIPIYAACALWGHKLHCKKILFHSDNLGCVQAWANLGSSNAGVLSLMRAMVALAAQFNFAMNIVHVDGVNNEIADSLSRFQMSRFAILAPNASSSPVAIQPSTREVIARHLVCPFKRNSFSEIIFPSPQEIVILPASTGS